MPSTSTGRVALYRRVSTSEQADGGTSLDTQLARCQEYATAHGYRIVGEFSDVATGARYRDREGLGELRALVRAGAVDIVLAYAIDRLTRNQAHLAIIAEEADDHGARLEFVTEDFEDSAVGRFIRSAKAFAAEVEREKITERTLRGKRERVRSGKLLIPRQPAYGLLPNADRTSYVIDELRAPVVLRIVTEVAARRPLRQIAIGLSADHIPTATGKERWSTTVIVQIARNPAYVGDAIGWRWTHRGKRDASEHIHLNVVIPAIVPRDVWDAAQRVLDSHRDNKPGAVRYPDATLLRGGIARCGYCGRSMKVGWWDGRPYYVCTSRDDPSGVCIGASMTATKLDRQVWARIEALLRGDYSVGMLAPRHAAAERLALVDAQLTALDTERERVMRELTLTDDADALAIWRARLASNAEQRRAFLTTRAGILPGVEHERADAERLESARRLLADGDAPAQRRRIIEALGYIVTVFRANRQPRWEVALPAE